jgi:hypothetical protein
MAINPKLVRDELIRLLPSTRFVLVYATEDGELITVGSDPMPEDLLSLADAWVAEQREGKYDKLD